MLSLGKSVVEWSSKNKKQIDEAKKIYIEARKQNRKITTIDNKQIDKFTPELESFRIGEVAIGLDEILVRLVNETGDERIMWNLADPIQTRGAAEKFQEYLKKGWKAYAISEDGKKTKRIFAFDPNAEEISFDEKNNIKERLKDFAKQFKKVEVLPRTFPG